MKDTTKKYILIAAAVLTGIFIISFAAFDWYLSSKVDDSDEDTKTTLIQGNGDVLKGDVLVSLYKDNNMEKAVLLNELKKELNLSGDITEAKLSETLKKDGYNLYKIEGNGLVYVRTIESSVEPNKYYIGRHDDNLAIYKSDAAGNLTIENPKQDIYEKKFKQLPQNDQKLIESYELKYDTHDDAEEAISAYTS